MSKTIFEKIVDREIDAHIIYEDEHIISFLDAFPVSHGHALVVPKKPIENIFEMDQETSKRLMPVIQKVAAAINETFNPKGLNILQNNGEYASQSVFHIHFHIIPRYDDAHDGLTLGWETVKDALSDEDKEQMVSDIQSKLL